ncbi:EamA family transporter [Pseudomonas sp. KNUC1026]|uniref:EamA family transporter n=1 Tax=Pseudomonas sp. KNUC1026 TaxID=2893890 RepID=UPI001F3726B4|nr:EamA family transporter [Pseudomonas sp. KNUC1026]UFH48680.1 EamA family transporter [Pseudomonas sp. KNUC1026]
MAHADLSTTLVLISALMHASWNAVVKASPDRVLTMASVDIVAFIIALLAMPWFAPPPLTVWGLIGCSVLANLLYRAGLLRAYRLGDFGQVYPLVRGLPPLLVAVLASLWLGERLSALGWVGVALISAGILSLLRGHGHWPATVAALGAGACVGLYTVIDATGVRQSDAVGYMVYFTLALSLPTPAWALARRGRARFAEHWQTRWRLSVFGGITYTGAYTLVLVAMALGSVAQAAALRECSVILAALIARWLFREPFGTRRLIAAVVVAAGIVIIKVQ